MTDLYEHELVQIHSKQKIVRTLQISVFGNRGHCVPQDKQEGEPSQSPKTIICDRICYANSIMRYLIICDGTIKGKGTDYGTKHAAIQRTTSSGGLEFKYQTKCLDTENKYSLH